MGNLFKLSLIELIGYLIIHPETIAPLPAIGNLFVWLNSVLVPTGFESDNFIQKAVGGTVDWIYSFEFIGALLDLALIIIPIAYIVCLIIVYPVSRIAKKIEVRKIQKDRSSYTRPTPRWGDSHILNNVEKAQHWYALKKLQEDTVFAFIPQNTTCIRIQTLYPQNAENPDVVLDWDNNKTVTFPYETEDGEAEIFCYLRGEQAYISVRGEKEVPLTLNVPFGISDNREYQPTLKYAVTWIGGR